MKQFLIIFILFSCCVCVKSNTDDALYVKLKYAKSLKAKLQIRYEIGEKFVIMRKTYWDSVYNDSKKIKFREMEGKALNNIGSVFLQENNFKQALLCFKKSLKIREQINDESGIAESNNNIAFIYGYQGDSESAIAIFFKSLKIREKQNDQQGIASIYGNLAYLYALQNEFDKSLEYNQKSFNIYKKLSDKDGMSRALNVIGTYNQRFGKLDLALKNFTQSLTYVKEIGNDANIATSLDNIAGVYEMMGDFDKAMEYNYSGLAIQEKIGDKQGMAYSMNDIANILFKEGKINEAAQYADSALKIAYALGLPDIIKRVASTQKIICHKLKQYKWAYEFYVLEIRMRDSINNEETKSAAIRNQMKYEFGKKAVADSVNHAEEQKVKDAQLFEQEANLKQEATQRYTMYGGILLVTLFLIFVIHRFRVTNKQKIIIEDQKIQVDKAFEELHERNKEVMDSIRYARRIQTALLPSEKYVERYVKLSKK